MKRMSPLFLAGDVGEAQKAVLEWLAGHARVRVVETEETYIRAEFTSLAFRFVDDVELLFVPEQRILHFRSASRVGRSGLGVNRRRMKRFSREMSKRGFSPSPP
jgi:uncharacterized protein (DUF1499 family)